MTGARGAESGEPEPIRYVDKRRIDPDTGWVRSAPARVAGSAIGSTGFADDAGRSTASRASAAPDAEAAPEAESAAPHSVTPKEAAATAEPSAPTAESDADVAEVIIEETDDVVVDDVESDGEGSGNAGADAAKVGELMADLQRMTAEYANYRRRAERERAAAADGAKVAVVRQFLPVLDDLDRARRHGDLETGPMRALSDKLTSVLEGLGLVAFGAEGDAFDPELHEAVQHEGDGSNPVLGVVMRCGYRLGDKLVRTAMVGVVDAPAESAAKDA